MTASSVGPSCIVYTDSIDLFPLDQILSTHCAYTCVRSSNFLFLSNDVPIHLR